VSDCQAGGKKFNHHFDIDFCCCSRTNQHTGDPEYSDVRNEFYKNVDGALLTFDVTSKRSFESLGSWLKEANRYGLSSDTTTTMLVVGNKIDHRPREVTEQEVRELALK
jgi:DnaJ family protein C protein 27